MRKRTRIAEIKRQIDWIRNNTLKWNGAEYEPFLRQCDKDKIAELEEELKMLTIKPTKIHERP